MMRACLQRERDEGPQKTRSAEGISPIRQCANELSKVIRPTDQHHTVGLLTGGPRPQSEGFGSHGPCQVLHKRDEVIEAYVLRDTAGDSRALGNPCRAPSRGTCMVAGGPTPLGSARAQQVHSGEPRAVEHLLRSSSYASRAHQEMVLNIPSIVPFLCAARSGGASRPTTAGSSRSAPAALETVASGQLDALNIDTVANKLREALVEEERWLLEEVEALMGLIEEETEVPARRQQPAPPCVPSTAELREYKHKLAHEARRREYESELEAKLVPFPEAAVRSTGSNSGSRPSGARTAEGYPSPCRGGSLPSKSSLKDFCGRDAIGGAVSGAGSQASCLTPPKPSRARQRIQDLRDEQYFLP
jgi:hypothetical protein